jgi:hypothetical protein
MPYEYQTIEVSDFYDFLMKIKVNCIADVSLFRGQNEDKPLIPKIKRLAYRKEIGILANEKKLFQEFKRLSIPYIRNSPKNDWEWISIAQHHGLPTRLLDWSTNPLAALYFAIEKTKPKDGDSVVWNLEPDENDI